MLIDLRSDTVTKPSIGMKKAMYDAEVGDDVYSDDPTVNRLEAEAAERLGKESAVFMASGTQSNLSAVLSYCNRGDEIIIGKSYHISQDEAAGVSVLGGVAITNVEVDNDKSILPNVISSAFKPDDSHCPISRLVCLENTSSGRSIKLSKIQSNSNEAKKLGLGVHLDGARFFNAIADLKCTELALANCSDSISVCLSKGLGSPAGSILVLPKELEKKARRIRKLLGGGMRQAGVLAAAGIYALKNNVKRLKEDHEKAAELAKFLCTYGKTITQHNIENHTNMVFFAPLKKDTKPLISFMQKRGITLSNPSGYPNIPYIRIVLHLGVSDQGLNIIINQFKQFYN